MKNSATSRESGAPPETAKRTGRRGAPGSCEKTSLSAIADFSPRPPGSGSALDAIRQRARAPTPQRPVEDLLLRAGCPRRRCPGSARAPSRRRAARRRSTCGLTSCRLSRDLSTRSRRRRSCSRVEVAVVDHPLEDVRERQEGERASRRARTGRTRASR